MAEVDSHRMGPPGTGAPTTLSPRRRAAVTGTVLASMAMVVLNATALQAILPTLARSFAVPPAEAVRVMTHYQLALAMALLPCAALGESLGHHRVFRGGVVLFVIASALCLAAPGLKALLAARFLQGLGGACVMALGIPLLRLNLPQPLIGPAIGWNALTVALASSVGPSLGALAATGDHWRGLFALQMLLGAGVWLAGAALALQPGTGAPPAPGSVALSAGGVAALFLGLDRLLAHPASGMAVLILGAACLVVLVRHERGATTPLVPVDLLAITPLRRAAMASVLCFTGVSMALVGLPFYLQDGLGMTASAAGLMLTPWPLAVAAVAPLAGRLSGRIATGRLCALGAAALSAGLAGLAPGPASRVDQSLLVGLMVLCGAGFGLFQTPNNHTLFLSAPLARAGGAGGIQGTARLLGQTTGALSMSMLLTLADPASAARLGFAIGAAFTVTAGLISLARAATPAPP